MLKTGLIFKYVPRHEGFSNLQLKRRQRRGHDAHSGQMVIVLSHLRGRTEKNDAYLVQASDGWLAYVFNDELHDAHLNELQKHNGSLTAH